jgi:cation transport regulator ChaB
MTEAKLNYMIGETDAVLRSMCSDINSDEDLKRLNNSSRQQQQQQKVSNTDLNTSVNQSNPGKCQNHHHLTQNPSCGNHLPSTMRHQLPTPNEEIVTTSIEEMTRLYLDNYKRQLEDSRKELNTKMSLLEKEKEKVSKIRDIRKREQYMRRQAAIEAFKLEREREMCVPSTVK